MAEVNGNAFHFAFIAPYSQLADVALSQAKIVGCQLTIINGAFDTVARQISTLSDDVSVVISRGGTAEKIRQYTAKPVVAIESSVLDLLMLLSPLKGAGCRVAVVLYQNYLPGVDVISDILDINIEQYIFYCQDDIDELFLNNPSRFDIVVGGILVVNAAKKHGIKTQLLPTDKDAIYRALNQAVVLARAEDESRGRALQLDAMLASIAESLIVTDVHNKVLQVNPSALEILQLSFDEVIGRDVSSLLPSLDTQKVLLSGKKSLGDLVEVHGATFVSNSMPIINKGKCIGVVCTLLESQVIRDAETCLRKKDIVHQGFMARYNFSDIKTDNAEMHTVKLLSAHYATTDANILIQGESGTGKELFAQSIHRSSSRKNNPFVAINCAAIPENLLESELFGYVDGAFTGANRKGKAGLFELAHGGTLFLDEIGELPLNMQTKLLRVLQEKEIRRVGGSEVFPVDVRIITATNRDLHQFVTKRLFRNDLYYRLNALHVFLPPLRQRGDDIFMLSKIFLRESDCKIDDVQCKALFNSFKNYPFDGNVRELKSIIERFAILHQIFPDISQQELIDQYCLLGDNHSSDLDEDKSDACTEGGFIECKVPLLNDFKAMTGIFQRSLIRFYLKKHGNNQSKVASQLKISKMSIYRHLNER